ncbi:MAG: GTP-binding protein gtr2 [Candelaria pacifica]|nr:MAG: GTP-binding protein gtr2 [Candelaria pacifica]
MSFLSTPAQRHEVDSQEEQRPRKTAATLTLERYLQDQATADDPNAFGKPLFHTGRLPNGKLGDQKPRLLLMGQRRSGKSSISSVVFHKMPPQETLFLESTTRIQKESMHSFMDFQVLDFPGQLNYLDPTFDFEEIFGETGALIWVIDAQDEYLEAIAGLNRTILSLQQSYPSINIEVFIHKVDGLSEDYKIDTFRDIVQRIQDELSDAGYENAPVSFYQTSIYDHSIFEAFSKVIQKLIPQLPTLESLLNNLCSACRMEKAYLFDVLSKIYIATDTSPVDMPSYEICSDYIDVIVDISEIYGSDEPDKDDPGYARANPDADSIISLQSGNYLYLKEINKYLALICITKEASTEQRGLIDNNVDVFQDALAQVFDMQR